MLDKNVPYAGLFMKRAASPAPSRHVLPEGYTFAMYRAGDEAHWAKIEASVLEFDGEFPATLYFKEKYKGNTRDLAERCVFIKNEAGERVATATAWWETIGGKRRPWLHWVAVRPDHQRRGLGRALISHATCLLLALEGERDLFLHTQTWSYRAIRIYELCGFRITDEPELYSNPRDNYKKAVKILRRIYANRNWGGDGNRGTPSFS